MKIKRKISTKEFKEYVNKIDDDADINATITEYKEPSKWEMAIISIGIGIAVLVLAMIIVVALNAINIGMHGVFNLMGWKEDYADIICGSVLLAALLITYVRMAYKELTKKLNQKEDNQNGEQ